MSETIITVVGRFEARHPAERGTVRVSVGSEGPDRAPVVRQVSGLHGELSVEARLLADEGVVSRWSADRLRVWNSRPWGQDGAQLPVVHHASAELEVEFADLGRLAAWAEEVGVREGVTVADIRWSLTEATRASAATAAQHAAVRDAVARATAYATSLGLTTVRPVAIADPGLLEDPSAALGERGMLVMDRAMAKVADDGGLELNPEDIPVEAAVHARFAAS